MPTHNYIDLMYFLYCFNPTFDYSPNIICMYNIQRAQLGYMYYNIHSRTALSSALPICIHNFMAKASASILSRSQ